MKLHIVTIILTKLPFKLTKQEIEAAKKIEFEPETMGRMPQQTTKNIAYSFVAL